jgi:hypothetical protein
MFDKVTHIPEKEIGKDYYKTLHGMLKTITKH